MYLDEPDHTGHDPGPDTDEVRFTIISSLNILIKITFILVGKK